MDLSRFSHLCAYMNSLSKEKIKVFSSLTSVMLSWPFSGQKSEPCPWNLSCSSGWCPWCWRHSRKPQKESMGKQSVVTQWSRVYKILEPSDSSDLQFVWILQSYLEVALPLERGIAIQHKAFACPAQVCRVLASVGMQGSWRLSFPGWDWRGRQESLKDSKNGKNGKNMKASWYSLCTTSTGFRAPSLVVCKRHTFPRQGWFITYPIQRQMHSSDCQVGNFLRWDEMTAKLAISSYPYSYIMAIYLFPALKWLVHAIHLSSEEAPW